MLIAQTENEFVEDLPQIWLVKKVQTDTNGNANAARHMTSVQSLPDP